MNEQQLVYSKDAFLGDRLIVRAQIYAYDDNDISCHFRISDGYDNIGIEVYNKEDVIQLDALIDALVDYAVEVKKVIK